MFLIPQCQNSEELVIKKSRFIAIAQCANDRAEAMGALSKAKIDYSDASHHCWAYLIGNPQSPTSQAMSDDGEPSGTAGKPILNVLQHKSVGNIMVIVVRYFGGIKLGVGGLVRAYSSATQSVIETLVTSQYISLEELTVKINYAEEQALRFWVSQNQGNVIDVHYKENVVCKITIPKENRSGFDAQCHARNWVVVAG